MTADVSTLVRWGSTEPHDVLMQAVQQLREEMRAGAQSVGVVVGRVTVAADGTKFYDVFYSTMCPDEMLWLSKRIEQEALDDGDDDV